VTYNTFIERVREMNESEELPLNLDARRDLAKAEKELADLQDKLADQHDDSLNDDALEKDLILSEATMILSDFITLREKLGPLPKPSEDTETERSARGVGEWLRNLMPELTP
jgi:hypothetical protein